MSSADVPPTRGYAISVMVAMTLNDSSIATGGC